MSESENGRVETFSDGVFAVAITLLVLDLKVPDLRDITPKTNLWHFLAHQWPSFMAFVTSFITILIIWLNHHMVMKLIQDNDGGFMLINGLLLLFITLLPFSTAVLSGSIGHPTERDAIVLYNGSMFAVAFSFRVFWRYAIRNERLIGSESNKAGVKRISSQFNTGFLLYTIAFVSSFFIPLISLALIVFLAAYFLVVGIFQKKDLIVN